MKHKIGDLVRIKSRDWYEKNKNENGHFALKDEVFTQGMSKYLGMTAKITEIFASGLAYGLDIDSEYKWTDEMFEDEDVSNEDKNLEIKKAIDWEQRRWELFRIFLSDVCLLQPWGTTDESLAKQAIDKADTFIKLFKNI